MKDKHTLTCISATYNEESRITSWLKNVTRWADEVIVFDKGSTDRTRAICETFNVRIIDIPYSNAGEENILESVAHVQTDWFVWSTPSEVFKPGLIKLFRYAIQSDDGTLDLVHAPVKFYAFGAHSPGTPYGVLSLPKLINKHRAIIKNQIHGNFQSTSNSRYINYNEDTYLLHQTHPTFNQFIARQVEYAKVEALHSNNLIETARLALANSSRFDYDFLSNPESDIRHFLGWKIYNYMTALACHDAMHKDDTLKDYQKRIDTILNEWN
jgi:(heptosyl)LPS beta-1,4-glucosyltransferase